MQYGLTITNILQSDALNILNLYLVTVNIQFIAHKYIFNFAFDVAKSSFIIQCFLFICVYNQDIIIKDCSYWDASFLRYD